MDAVPNGVTPTKLDDEQSRRTKRAALKELNLSEAGKGTPRSLISLNGTAPLTLSKLEPEKALDSSLKRHTALIKRTRQTLGAENHDQIVKDINSLSLEKYVDEIVGAVVEGISRCKTEKDVWSAVEVRLNSAPLRDPCIAHCQDL